MKSKFPGTIPLASHPEALSEPPLWPPCKVQHVAPKTAVGVARKTAAQTYFCSMPQIALLLEVA